MPSAKPFVVGGTGGPVVLEKGAELRSLGFPQTTGNREFESWFATIMFVGLSVLGLL